MVTRPYPFTLPDPIKVSSPHTIKPKLGMVCACDVMIPVELDVVVLYIESGLGCIFIHNVITLSSNKQKSSTQTHQHKQTPTCLVDKISDH